MIETGVFGWTPKSAIVLHWDQRLVTLFAERTANLQSDSCSRLTLADDRYPRASELTLHMSAKEGEHE